MPFVSNVTLIKKMVNLCIHRYKNVVAMTNIGLTFRYGNLNYNFLGVRYAISYCYFVLANISIFRKTYTRLRTYADNDLFVLLTELARYY